MPPSVLLPLPVPVPVPLNIKVAQGPRGQEGERPAIHHHQPHAINAVSVLTDGHGEEDAADEVEHEIGTQL
jgi:hypothetical protein